MLSLTNGMQFQIRESDHHQKHQHQQHHHHKENTVNIPLDLPSPKSPPAAEKRSSLQRHAEPKEKEHREHNGGAKANYNNNKTNSACLNNLILPLLSEVSPSARYQRNKRVIRLFFCRTPDDFIAPLA